MSRINDIVFIFTGGKPFSETFSVEAEFNLQLWYDNEKKLPYRRRILAESRGTDHKTIQNNLDAVKAKIIKEFGRIDTIGQVCLLGRSSGCLLALALAAELNAQGVAELTFVGLSDVPMSHNGNDPPVPHVGAIKPKNGPIASGAEAPIGWRGTLKGVQPVSEVPHANLAKEIKVRKGNKIQLYQKQGNHTKYASSRNEWIWHSDKSMEGEVHGELDDGEWVNRLKEVKGGRFTTEDLDFHVNLNSGEHWKAMCSDAAAAFARLPQQPLP